MAVVAETSAVELDVSIKRGNFRSLVVDPSNPTRPINPLYQSSKAGTREKPIPRGHNAQRAT